MKKQHNIPDVLINQITKICQHYNLTENAISDIIKTFSQDKESAFRVNTLKSSVAEVCEILTSEGLSFNPVAWSDVSFLIDDKTKLARLPQAKEGLFYIQNLSSQLTVVTLEPREEEFILDLAAAPGGKTGFIAQLMHNNGRISAVEPVKDRYFRLIHNLRNLGVTIVKCYQKDGRVVGGLCNEWFDRVLLDAPCSSMAQIDFRHPESFEHWSLKKVKECSRKQKQLIVSAFDSLKPGSEMVYSTCSWMVEENEEVVDHLIQTFPNSVEILGFELPIQNYLPGLTNYQDSNYNPEMVKTCRIVPNQQFEAFYIAKLRKLMKE